MIRRPPRSTPLSLHDALPIYLCRVFFTGAFRRPRELNWVVGFVLLTLALAEGFTGYSLPDRKSTRLNSSHANISYAVFCLKKKTKLHTRQYLKHSSS